MSGGGVCISIAFLCTTQKNCSLGSVLLNPREEPSLVSKIMFKNFLNDPTCVRPCALYRALSHVIHEEGGAVITVSVT